MDTQIDDVENSLGNENNMGNDNSLATNNGAWLNVNVTGPSSAGLHYANMVQYDIHNVINTGPISYINVVSPTSSSHNVSNNTNGGEKVGNDHVNEFPSSYVLNDDDYDIWLHLASVHEFSSKEGVDLVLRDVIMEYLVKISKKARILELKQRYLKITVLTSYTLYPSRKIRRICACTSLKTIEEKGSIRRVQRRPIRRI
ncbi:hypothetical protein Tco_1223713 [Tanacetum coccineum]